MACSGCSLILDFNNSQIPKDAMADAPYTLAECNYKEPNGTLAMAAMIDPATDMGPAAICGPTDDAGTDDDDDFFEFAVPTGTTSVSVSIAFTERAGGDLDLRLWDTMGNMVSQSRGFGPGELIVCPGAAPACPTLAAGNYIFEVFPGVTGAVNVYTFSVVLQ